MHVSAGLLVHYCKLTCASYTFAVGIASAAIYSVLAAIEEDTNLTLADLNAGTGYMVLTLQSSKKHKLKGHEVSGFRLGLSDMATLGAAVRQTPGLLDLGLSNHGEFYSLSEPPQDKDLQYSGNPDLGSLHENKWYVDSQ